MPVAEQQQRIRTMQERLARYDVVTWAKDCVDQLLRIKQTQEARQTRPLSAAAQAAPTAA